MKHFLWDDQKYGTDVKQLDEQHKVLFKLINEIYEKNNLKSPHHEIAEILNELRVWIGVHFTEEEKYLKSLSYPGIDIETHINIHRRLLTTYTQFMENYNKDLVLTPAFFQFIEDWLESHIMHVDMQYSPTKSRFHKKTA